MGLLPADSEIAQEAPVEVSSPTSLEEGDGDEDAHEEPEAIGLIGHFEAADLLTHKGKEGPFVGSLDMTMSTRQLMSTEEGVGENQCCAI